MSPHARARIATALALAATALAPTAARAAVHQVAAGETLSQIAAANGTTPAALAAANGVDADAPLPVGHVLQVGTTGGGAPATASSAAPATTSPSSSAPTATPATSTTTAPPALGGYTVRAGDTLSALAATAGVTTFELARRNGLDPDAVLPAGTVVQLPAGSPAPTRSTTPAPHATYPAGAPPAPSGEHVTGSEIGAVATRNGVSAGLAKAVAWQESGFDNAAVSTANARGVMQVLPGTWSFVQASLARRRLDPSSAIDNVGAGVLYLGSLLRDTNDERTAIAGYYQGLDSVRRHGLLPETQRYVDDVEALHAKFGG